MSEDTEFKIAFDGPIEFLPDISVDNFNDKTKDAYFLSHAHTDHLSGLTQGIFKGTATIYMTPETKTILSNKYKSQYEKFSSNVEELKSGTRWHKITINRKEVQLTLIPVVHMPGAVMFLFKTSGGKVILYTGDFVMNDAELENFKKLGWLLAEDGQRIGVDLLYYDATFRHMKKFRESSIKTLPDRSNCIKVAVNEIRKWLDKAPSNAVAIFKYYDYGYEELFKGIYGGLEKNERFLLLNREQRNAYSKILKEDVKFYTNSPSRIHICNKKIKDGKVISECTFNGCGKNSKYMYINVYAFPCEEPIKRSYLKKPNAYDLCFPTHCSDSQLKKFIDYIDPSLSPVPFPSLDEGGPSTPSRGIKRPQPMTPTKMNTNKMVRPELPSKMKPV